jgi:hypothetical protein
MAVDHAWEQFNNAIRFALVSDAPIQERLGYLISEVCHLQRDSFPDEQVWDEFRKLLDKTTKRKTAGKGEGRIDTTSQMSEDRAKECLQTAFDIFSHVAKAFGRAEFVI